MVSSKRNRNTTTSVALPPALDSALATISATMRVATWNIVDNGSGQIEVAMTWTAMTPSPEGNIKSPRSKGWKSPAKKARDKRRYVNWLERQERRIKTEEVKFYLDKNSQRDKSEITVLYSPERSQCTSCDKSTCSSCTCVSSQMEEKCNLQLTTDESQTNSCCISELDPTVLPFKPRVHQPQRGEKMQGSESRGPLDTNQHQSTQCSFLSSLSLSPEVATEDLITELKETSGRNGPWCSVCAEETWLRYFRCLDCVPEFIICKDCHAVGCHDHHHMEEVNFIADSIIRGFKTELHNLFDSISDGRSNSLANWKG